MLWRHFVADLRQLTRGIKTISTLFQVVESGIRQKLPHTLYIWPINAYTIDDPWKSEYYYLDHRRALLGAGYRLIEAGLTSSEYANARSDLFASITYTGSTPRSVTTSPAAALMISTKSSVLNKPTDMFRNKVINMFGPQLVSTRNGPEHRRHRGVVKG